MEKVLIEVAVVQVQMETRKKDATNREFDKKSVLIQILFEDILILHQWNFILEGQDPSACIGDIDNLEAPPSSVILLGGHMSKRRLAGQSWLFVDHKQKLIKKSILVYRASHVSLSVPLTVSINRVLTF